MKPELLINPRHTPLKFEYPGGPEGLLRDLDFEAKAEGFWLVESARDSVIELLARASLGLLRYRRDVKLFQAALPDALFEIRFDLQTLDLSWLSARLFAVEKPPETIRLIGWHLKGKDQYFDLERERQTQAALKLLRKTRSSDELWRW